MKNKIVVIGFLCALFGLTSCEDDSLKVQLNQNITANELSDLPSSTYELTLEEAQNTFETFTWTAPDFGFAAVTSYVVQIDKAGNNFASAESLLATTTSLSGSITVGDLNSKLLSLGLSPDEESNVELRVRSSVSDNVDPVYSNVIQFSVTPYATTFPPLIMIGDATGGWDWPVSVKVRNIAPGVYKAEAMFTKNGKFRFFVTPSWDGVQYNWSTFESGSIDANLTNSGDSDGNFIFGGDTGWYTITVDLKNKTVVMAVTEEPKLYMIGDAVQGWVLEQAVPLTRLESGLFEATTTFTSGNIFRFFTAPDWGKGTVNSGYFAGGQIDSKLEIVGDGDGNFRVKAATGSYKITVDLYAKKIVMQ